MNFIPRFVQISQRAFRYFKNEQDAVKGKPIVAIRKKIIDVVKPYKVNKFSYLKPGSRIAKSGKEDHLFDCMFEIMLEEDYEDNYDYRKEEWENKDRRDREEFQRWANSSNSRSPRLSRQGTSMNSPQSSK